MSILSPVLDRIDADLNDSLERLFGLLRIPSISTDSAYKDDCQSAAAYLADALQSIGFEASVRPTNGHPMVVGHHEGEGPHILFYGHYDVQPVDPLDLWHSDPFEPQIETLDNGQKIIRARGASDDKGQLMTFLEACRAWKAVHGKLPLKISVFLEGEEESGSPSMVPFLEQNADELKADFAVVCDTGMWDAKTPAICTGLRGNVTEEVTVFAANRDLHSGLYGGAAANPIHILTRVLADLRDDQGRVQIDGFYDGVRETPPEILAQWNELEGADQKLLGDIGLSLPAGETGRSALELTWARPTAEVNGIFGGYTGEGFKTVIPAKATAKVSFRLVHDQDPVKISQSFHEFVKARIPHDCKVEHHTFGLAAALQLDYDLPFLQTAQDALSQEWPNDAALVAMGGSIPVVAEFRDILGMETLLVGFGLADDQIHSPDEKYSLTSYHHGQRSWARILAGLSAQQT